MLDEDIPVTAKKICKICIKDYSKYTCPKCDIPYCSLVCYKKHGENCIDTFYHENIVDNLKSLKSTNEEKAEMLNILRRVKEAEEAQTSNDSLIEKLEKLDLNDPCLFDKLTKEEQETFTKMIATNEWASIFQLWKPWWLKSSRIIEIDDNDNEELKDDQDDEFSPLPQIPKDIPPLSTIYKKEPAEEMAYNLIDLLYCYVFCQRLYDGDPFTDIGSFISTFWSISSVIPLNKAFGSTPLVFSTLLDRVIATKEVYPHHFLLSLFEDVEKITDSKLFTITAIYDLYLIFVHFCQSYNKVVKENKASPLSKIKKSVFDAATKKLYFYFLWANQLEEYVLGFINSEINQEVAEKSEFYESLNTKNEVKITPIIK
jgi:hypothetical protein